MVSGSGFSDLALVLPSFSRLFTAAIVVTLTHQASHPAETNRWIKAGNGSWNENAWSLGQLPNDSQVVEITSEAPKSVEIDPETVQLAPASLAIQSLFISGENTLLLNVPNAQLRVTSPTNVGNGLTLSNGGTLVNLGMDLQIGNTNRSVLMIQGGMLFQDGGSVSARTTYIVSQGQYHLTNGVFECDYLDSPSGGFFAQYGGRVELGSSRLLYSTNSLLGGEMLIRDGLSVSDSSTFLQSGGINRVPSLSVAPNSAGGGRYSISGGLLATSNTFVGAFRTSSEMNQSGGVHVITNSLRLQGSSRYYPPQHSPGRYNFSGGAFYASEVELDSTFGRAEFIQSGGSAHVFGSLHFNRPVDIALDRGLLKLEGGTLAVQNIAHSAAGADIVQTGGSLIVSNLFSFGGFIPPPYDYGSPTRRIPRYDFSGGTFSARDIELQGEWIIGSTEVEQRISNPGSFVMAGTLRVGDANEQLGHLVLSSNAVIDFALGDGTLAFAKSSSANWNPEATLIITNWSGSLSGNGSDQLRFGNNRSGLSPAQLNQILFASPAGLPPSSDYSAGISDTGEIVPGAPLPAAIQLDYSAAPVTLIYPAGYMLQTSTNLPGPFEDLPNQTSPYNIQTTNSPLRFFRLRMRSFE